jgi:hypothetical protein
VEDIPLSDDEKNDLRAKFNAANEKVEAIEPYLKENHSWYDLRSSEIMNRLREYRSRLLNIEKQEEQQKEEELQEIKEEQAEEQ